MTLHVYSNGVHGDMCSSKFYMDCKSGTITTKPLRTNPQLINGSAQFHFQFGTLFITAVCSQRSGGGTFG
jgi:hypothetical protein